MAQHDGTAAPGGPQGNDAFDTRPIPQAEPGAAVEPAGQPNAGGNVGRAVREIVETLLLAALIFFAVRLVVLNFRVDGESMAPNLHNEEMLLVNRNAYRSFDLGPLGGLIPGASADSDQRFYPFDPPERGDIVVFDPPTNSNKPYIKRVIGLPGEEITFQGGDVYVDGERLDEPYIDQETTCGAREQCDVVVPEGEIFVLGDNRGNSSDSRVFGPVPIEQVIGKAWLAYWPPSDVGFVPHYDYPAISETSTAGAPAGSLAPVAPPPVPETGGGLADGPTGAAASPATETRAKKGGKRVRQKDGDGEKRGAKQRKNRDGAERQRAAVATPGA